MRPRLQVRSVRAVPPRRGQGMTEYILLVALVAIATIGLVSLYGNNVRALFGESAHALAGSTSGKNSRSKAGSAEKSLSNFGVVQGGGSDTGRTQKPD